MIDQLRTIIAFHSLTGCNTVSQFAAIGKKTAWKMFTYSSSLQIIGSKDVDGQLMKDVEKFVCKLYMYLKDTDITEIDLVGKEIFLQGKRSQDAFPPTNDALEWHIRWANYQ